MKAMILAAGIGSRLRPLTDTTPKALIEVGGKPMLEIVIRRLINAGVGEIIVNTHHHAELVSKFLTENNNFGIRIEQSYEPELLDTGGGLKKTAWFFDDGRPFFVYNADAFTDIDLRALYAGFESARERGALAIMAVSARETSRYLAFGPDGFLRARWTDSPEFSACDKLANNVVYVLSPEIFKLMPETCAFPAMEFYLRLAREGKKIASFRSDKWFWADIGSVDKLEKARQIALKTGIPQ